MSQDPAYKKAIVYRKEFEKKEIEAGSKVDLHNPPYDDESWEGPFTVSKIVKGGRIQLQGKRGQFFPGRLRLHTPS